MVPPKTNGRLPTTVRHIQSSDSCQKFCVMFHKSTPRQQSWANQCRFRLRFRRLASPASLILRVNWQLLVSLAKIRFRSHCRLLVRAASKKSPVSQLAHCGINFMFGATVGCRENWYNAQKQPATKQSWSLSIRQSSDGANAMCVVALRFHQKLVLKLLSTAFATRDGHLNS